MRGGEICIEGFEFSGTRVPNRNGAGIRFETGKLSLVRCHFIDKENGILTANDPDSELSVMESEFGHNGAGDGYSHNLYVGKISKLHVSGSHFHDASVGRLLRSRARQILILHNRLVDGELGRASYEFEFPSGGITLVTGNTIGQGPLTENPVPVSFGIEGYTWTQNELVMNDSRLIDDLSKGGKYVVVKAGARSISIDGTRLEGRSGTRIRALTVDEAR